MFHDCIVQCCYNSEPGDVPRLTQKLLAQHPSEGVIPTWLPSFGFTMSLTEVHFSSFSDLPTKPQISVCSLTVSIFFIIFLFSLKKYILTYIQLVWIMQVKDKGSTLRFWGKMKGREMGVI
jgi:hypothetical protein